MRKTSLWFIIGAVAFGVVWGGRNPAFADDKQAEADKLLRRGVELRRAHDDEAAAREFRKAYDLVRTPRAAAQLGMAKQALGLWEDAEQYLGEALRSPEDAWVAKNKPTLDGAMGIIQTHLGRVEVIGDPEGAEVAINGRRVGKLPLGEPVRVSAGQVDVDVAATGYSPVQRTVTLVGGQYQRVVVHLLKVEAAPPAPVASTNSAAMPISAPTVTSSSTSTDASTPTSASAGASVTASSETTEHGPSGTRVALKWTAAGLAVAGVATGIVGVVMHGSDVSAFDNHPCRVKDGMGVLVNGMADSRCQSLLDAYQTDQKIAVAGFVAGGALAATWLILFLTEPTPSTRTAEQAARHPLCAPSLGGLGVSCAGRF
jgi:hypothetical protein